MFGFSSWLSRRAGRRPVRRLALRLETLEDRSVPAGVFVAGVGGVTQAKDPELSVYAGTGPSANNPLAGFHAEAFAGTTGDTRVALGDVNGDGTDDLIAGSGVGAQAQVVIFDGASAMRGSQVVLSRFTPYTNFLGGVFVAAGDFNHDGKAEVITTPGLGGRGHLKIFNFADSSGNFTSTPTVTTSAYTFADYNGEVRVAALRTNGETLVVTSSGAGVSGDVRAFRNADKIGGVPDRVPIPSQFLAARLKPFAGFTGGLSVAAGDTDGDGNDELFVSKNSGESSVAVFDVGAVAAASAQGNFSTAALATFDAFAGFLGEVHLGAADVNGDGKVEVLATTGFSGDRHGTPVKAFTRVGNTFSLVQSFYANPGYMPGAWLTSKDFVFHQAAGTSQQPVPGQGVSGSVGQPQPGGSLLNPDGGAGTSGGSTPPIGTPGSSGTPTTGSGASTTGVLRKPLAYVIDPSVHYPSNQHVPVGNGGVGVNPAGGVGVNPAGASGHGSSGSGTIDRSTIVESEPNDNTSNANPFTTSPSDPGLISGTISTGSDVDTFSFTLATRTAVFIDVNSVRIGLSTTLDSVLTLLDSSGTQLDQNDNGYNFDTGLPAQYQAASATTADSSLYRELNAGTYFIQVSSNSNTTGAYQVKVRADTNFLSSVPAFSSNPGAPNTVYLDFDGNSSSTDAWAASTGAYTAIPFDMSFNGNASEWSPGETELIRQIVRGLGEDYAPFDINFTTVDPGAITDGTSLRMIMTNSNPSIIGQSSGTLGVAFLGSFNNSDPTDNVAWGAFNGEFAGYNSFSGGTSGDIEALGIVIADTVAHEFGHTVTLNHYTNMPNLIMNDTNFGLGGKLWANQTNVNGNNQDDMQLIASIGASNSTAYRADDAGNSIATATPLTPNASGYAFAGVISVLNTAAPANNDVDFFSFVASGTGLTRIKADVDEYLNDLNVVLRVFDSSGALVATDAPTTSFDGSLTLPLQDGAKYFVAVSSAGGAGEAGQYNLTVATPAPPQGGSGGSGQPNIPIGALEPNETSDQATDLGVIGPGSFTQGGLGIGIINGVPDYDWYFFGAGASGTYNFSLNEGATGQLEIHVFRQNSDGSLSELAVSNSGMSVPFLQGTVVYVEVKGISTGVGRFGTGAYTLSISVS